MLRQPVAPVSPCLSRDDFSLTRRTCGAAFGIRLTNIQPANIVFHGPVLGAYQLSEALRRYYWVGNPADAEIGQACQPHPRREVNSALLQRVFNSALLFVNSALAHGLCVRAQIYSTAAGLTVGLIGPLAVPLPSVPYAAPTISNPGVNKAIVTACRGSTATLKAWIFRDVKR